MNNKIDITFTIYPGIYEILDVDNNKSYYGETTELAGRWSRHYKELEKGVHHSRELQKAYTNKKTNDSFKFIVLYWGSYWDDLKKRQAKEQELINKNANRCYNSVHISNRRKEIHPIMYNGIRYDSISAASRGTGRSKSQIHRDIKDPTKVNIFILTDEVTEYGFIPIFAKKDDKKETPSVLFQSIQECVNAGYATNVQNARRKIQRKEDGWRYASIDESGKPIRQPYSLKEGELSYEMLKKSEIPNN